VVVGVRRHRCRWMMPSKGRARGEPVAAAAETRAQPPTGMSLKGFFHDFFKIHFSIF
jgi:hypothetical protein